MAWIGNFVGGGLSALILLSQASGSPGITQATVNHLGPQPQHPQPTVIRVIQVDNYALATWLWGEAGGQTFLKETDQGWRVLSSGGGAMDVGTLTQFGITAEKAKQLLQAH